MGGKSEEHEKSVPSEVPAGLFYNELVSREREVLDCV